MAGRALLAGYPRCDAWHMGIPCTLENSVNERFTLKEHFINTSKRYNTLKSVKRDAAKVLKTQLFGHCFQGVETVIIASDQWIHCDLMTPSLYILFNNSSGNGLLPDDIKSLPEPRLTYHQRGTLGIQFTAIFNLNYQDTNPKVVFEIYTFEITASHMS